MTRSSDKYSRWFERNIANDLKCELPLKVLLSSQKWLGRKITTLGCVIRGMIQAYLILKHKFNNTSFKFKNIQSQSYRNTSNVMHFGKVYFYPLHISLRSCGCIYDTKNLKVACLMRN